MVSPLPTTKEWGEGQGEGRPRRCGMNEPPPPHRKRGGGGGGGGVRPRRCGMNEPLSPTLSPLVPRGERERPGALAEPYRCTASPRPLHSWFDIAKGAGYGQGMSREYVLQPFRAPIQLQI